VADSFRDTPGLFQICIAEMDNGQMTSWSLWANEDAMNAAGPQIQEALSGLGEFVSGPPTISFGPMNAGQIYQTVRKDDPVQPFVVRLGFGSEYDEEKIDEFTDWIQNTVYAGYEGTEGLIGALAADVGDNKGVTLSNWESQEAIDSSQEKFQQIMADAMTYIKSPPTVVTGVCKIYINNVSFPAGKLSDWSK
jgi:quinol monooxygenase YgiN